MVLKDDPKPIYTKVSKIVCVRMIELADILTSDERSDKT